MAILDSFSSYLDKIISLTFLPSGVLERVLTYSHQLESQLCVSVPNSALSDLSLASWNQLWWVCLHHRNYQKLQIRVSSPNPPPWELIVKHQHTTAFIFQEWVCPLSLYRKSLNLLPHQHCKAFGRLFCSLCLSMITSERREVESHISPLIAVEPWTNYLISPRFSFPLCKTVMIKTISHLWVNVKFKLNSAYKIHFLTCSQLSIHFVILIIIPHTFTQDF